LQEKNQQMELLVFLCCHWHFYLFVFHKTIIAYAKRVGNMSAIFIFHKMKKQQVELLVFCVSMDLLTLCLSQDYYNIHKNA